MCTYIIMLKSQCKVGLSLLTLISYNYRQGSVHWPWSEFAVVYGTIFSAHIMYAAPHEYSYPYKYRVNTAKVYIGKLKRFIYPVGIFLNVNEVTMIINYTLSRLLKTDTNFSEF